MEIVFFGSGYYTIPIIEILREHGLVLVVTTEPKGRLIDYLIKKKIPYIYSKLKSVEDISKIENLKPDIGILASYGAIIPKKIIDIFPSGILNVHPSLLPAYKGPSPIQYQILAGIKNSGVSVISLDESVDHGPLVMQKPIKLYGDETLESMTELMFLEGSSLIQKIVQELENGKTLKAKPQSIKGETFTRKIKKEDGEIDLNKIPTGLEIGNWKLEIARKIRAYYPWPGVYLTASLAGKEKIVKFLPHGKIQVEGKNPMDYKSFINGYGTDAKTILQKLSLIKNP